MICEMAIDLMKFLLPSHFFIDHKRAMGSQAGWALKQSKIGAFVQKGNLSNVFHDVWE